MFFSLAGLKRSRFGLYGNSPTDAVTCHTEHVHYKLDTITLVGFLKLVKGATPARIVNNDEADPELQVMMQYYTRPVLLFLIDVLLPPFPSNK